MGSNPPNSSHPRIRSSSHGSLSISTLKTLGGMAAYDRRKRLTIGEALDHNNRTAMVVASPHSSPPSSRIGWPSRPTCTHQLHRPHSTGFPSPPLGSITATNPPSTRILRDGIRPGTHAPSSTDPRHVAIKLQATRGADISEEVITSPLNPEAISRGGFCHDPCHRPCRFPMVLGGSYPQYHRHPQNSLACHSLSLCPLV